MHARASMPYACVLSMPNACKQCCHAEAWKHVHPRRMQHACICAIMQYARHVHILHECTTYMLHECTRHVYTLHAFMHTACMQNIHAARDIYVLPRFINIRASLFSLPAPTAYAPRVSRARALSSSPLEVWGCKKTGSKINFSAPRFILGGSSN